MSFNAGLKMLISDLPTDVCGLVALHSPKEMFLIASASNRPSLKELAFRLAHKVKHVWISRWERDQSMKALIDRDLFYKKLSVRAYVNADKGVLSPSFYPPDVSKYSYYELYSKKPLADLIKFENAERKIVSNIFMQMDQPKDLAEARLFEERVRSLDLQMRTLRYKVKHTDNTIDLMTEIPFLLKLCFLVYDFFKSFFVSHKNQFSLHPIERPGYSYRRGNIGFHTYITGNTLD